MNDHALAAGKRSESIGLTLVIDGVTLNIIDDGSEAVTL